MKVFLKAHEEERLQKGHSWIFSNEVDHFDGNVVSGEIADVYSSKNEFIGRGFFNINSKIIVRLLTRQAELIDEEFWRKRINRAWNNRQMLDQTACRIIFSEADFMPGLIVDKYQDYLVVQILSMGMEKRKELIVKLLVEIIKPQGIYERSDASVRLKEGLPEQKGLLYGTINSSIIIEEHGIKISVDVLEGQKTGYFLDQCKNRAELQYYVKGQKVLDCFAHTGGFSLHASKYKAATVTAVDISQKACDDIMKNAKLNGFDNINVVCADVFDYLRKDETNQAYDVIVLDPPAFTKNKETLAKAYRGYKDINLQAMKCIKPNGILFTFSCSQHMTPDLFLQMLRDAAADAKRDVQMLDFRIQAPDHPVLLANEESFYLKCVVLRVL